MPDTDARRAHAVAWLFLAVHIGAHAAEEALTGSLDVEWLTILIIAVGGLIAVTPLVARGVRGFVPASYALAVLMIANGANHLLSPLYLGRFLPGQFTSPFLIFASAWLIVRTWEVSHPPGAGRAASSAVAGSFAFFFVAPATVAGWVPYAWTGWRIEPPLAGLPAGRVVGAALVAVSTAALIECFVRFALVGRGTPAPVVPTESLVVSGLYRFTRNPMYVAVVSATVGQALIFGSRGLLVYAAVVWLAFHVFVVGYEERALRRRFGNYTAYCRHVPRWIPRLSPWAASEKDLSG